ncbi:hypothetical protein [Sporosarcina trichiuri]|uniref:hypothetical protein n=1 Tax=Sporosarcina trichiuri TaxID=3056445 RepID=UPI0025B56D79|nr:hypothetical protein [Sporosarcina sp. 0.2-SM1T-5]WJY28376.1 hypothetical protein QWT68_05185 [Sporosarcina sp. 0.2-SM1T-5]
MKASQAELRAQVLQSQDVRLLEEQSWMLPAVRLAVSFETITKTTMDILMNMTLLTLQRLPLEQETDIARLLGVEALFVSDLLKMMEADGLVVRHRQWTITEKGKTQLQEGHYTHAAEKEQAILMYSPLLDVFFKEPETDASAAPENDFRYTWEEESWNPGMIPKDRLEAALAETVGLDNSENRTKTVGAVLEITQAGQAEYPCYEYRLYEKRTDSLFVRVWNTAAGQWDETLEEYILTRERGDWRQRYLTKEE